ncbi:beta-lactamase family protein [Streptomyces sp. SCA3-4]|uniref:serine hydrolase domain-containing protein n=1 Tax=Streptomyces sichuanensis TaxID=2871810 RepID=UPI001CE2C16D|nr:serine hydrolase domain-containing protein [Streptomyces sichuanensis]MCA6091340.1 beta-lactamase family protein [Streptomyces sichuanensis]
MRCSSALTLAAATAVSLALTAGASVQAASATPAAHTPAKPDRAALREAIAVHPGDGMAGAVAQVYTSGQTWRGASGDVVSGKRVTPDAHFRIGSVAKPMEAVILLQLSAEGRVNLDETVQHYLPGLLPDTFDDITVRQLLNHTSGLPQDFDGAPAPSQDEVIEGRFGYYTFDEIVQQTLRPQGRNRPGPRFAPGTKQEYNSLGYRIAGELIEKLTGHSFRQEVTTRILAPLKMKETYAPARTARIPAPYVPGYVPASKGEQIDVNEQGGLPSSLISTTADLDRFMTGLLSGRLLRPAQAAELFAVPRDVHGKPLPYADGSHCNTGPAKGTACFSTVLMSVPLPDGSVMWGKTGGDLGYRSAAFATPDLNRRVVYGYGTASADGGGAPPLATRLIAAISAG